MIRLLYCPCPNRTVARSIAQHLVETKLAACANLVPGICSIYLWQNAVQEDEEVLLLAKTEAAHAEACEQAIITHHPYDCPVILTLAPERLNPGAQAWLADSLG